MSCRCAPALPWHISTRCSSAAICCTPPVATLCYISHHYLQETYKQLLLALRAPNEGAALHYFVQVRQLAPKLQQLTFWVALSLSAVECAVASELPQDSTCEVSGVRGAGAEGGFIARFLTTQTCKQAAAVAHPRLAHLSGFIHRAGGDRLHLRLGPGVRQCLLPVWHTGRWVLYGSLKLRRRRARSAFQVCKSIYNVQRVSTALQAPGPPSQPGCMLRC